jgi:hypothetical protein
MMLPQKQPWSETEDSLLASLYEELGGKWQQIAKSLPGRTGLCCRNRWRKFKSDWKAAEKKNQNVGGNPGGTKKLQEGGRGRRKSSEEEETGAGSSTGSGTKAGAAGRGKGKGAKKRAIDEVSTPSDEQDSPRKRLATDPSPGLEDGLVDRLPSLPPPHPGYPPAVRQTLDNFSQLHSSHLDPNLDPHYNVAHDDYNLHHTNHFSSGLSLFRSTSPSNHSSQHPRPSSQPLTHHQPSYSPSFPSNSASSYDPLMDSALYRPPTYLSLNRPNDSYALPGIHESFNDTRRSPQFPPTDGLSRMTPFDLHRSDLSQALLQSAMSSTANHNNGTSDDRFKHLLQPDNAHLPPLNHASHPSPINHSSNPSVYSSSLCGTSPATTSTPETHSGGQSSHKSSTVASGEQSADAHDLAPAPSSSNNNLPSANVSHQLDNDDTSWISSFLAGLHNPSASLPPTALNSPVFTGGWEPALFSAPPSPVRQKYQSVMNGQGLDPEHPLIPASQFLNHPKLSEHADDPSSRNYKPAPTSPIAMPPPALPPHIIHQQQEQQQHQQRPYPLSHQPLPNHSLASPASQPAPPGSAASLLQQHKEISSRRQDISSLIDSPPLPPSSSSAPSISVPAFPVPSTSLPPLLNPSTQNQNHSLSPSLISPRPSINVPIQQQQQQSDPSQQYMIWDPRPPSETFKGPLVLVPAEILAGLIQRANESR